MKLTLAFGLAVLVLGSGGAMIAAGLAADGHWRQLSVTGGPPDARKHFVMVYDPAGDRVILYGGETHVGGNDVLLDDVWQLGLGTYPLWQELTPTNDATHGNPGGRHGHSGAYASGSPATMLIVGGRDSFDVTNPIADFESSSWKLSLGSPVAWTRLAAGFPTGNVQGCDEVDAAPFRPRTHAAGAYLSGGFFMFGGWDLWHFSMQDMWRHSTSAGTNWAHKSGNTDWEEVCPDHPDRRFNHTLTTDTGHDRMILFGGVYEDSPISNAWYTEDGISWTCLGQAATGTPGYSRNFHTAVYDSERERLVVLGGYDFQGTIVSAVTALPLPETLEEVSVNETNEDWTTLSITGTGPGVIAEHCAVYDSQQDRMIVFGGKTSGGELQEPDVWALEFDETAPAAATLSGSRAKNSATISWTAPGDDNTTGTAFTYDLRRSTSTITSGNFASATPIATDSPQAAGSTECATASGLSQCVTYYYALKTTDDAGNVSALSNVISMTQTCSGGQIYCAPPEGLNTPVVAAELSFGLGERAPGRGAVSLAWSIPPSLAGEGLDIQVFDVSGRRVATVERGIAVSGDHESNWAYVNDAGSKVPAGLYFVRLSVGSEFRNMKVLVEPGE